MKSTCSRRWVKAGKLAVVCAASLSLPVAADPIGSADVRTIGGVSTAVYVINVSDADYPRTAPYELTADDVADMGALPLWKEGTGAIAGNANMASYAGDIYVTEGVYRVDTLDALGTTAGATRVIGGTLECFYGGGWSWAGTDAALGAEPIFIEGEGYNGLGAIYSGVQAKKLYSGTLTLTGDALMTGDQDISMRGSDSTFNGGGHVFTVTVKGKSVEVMAGTFTNLQEFVVTKGRLALCHGLGVKTLPETVFRVKSGATCHFDGFKGIRSTLVLEDGTTITSGTDASRVTPYAAGGLPGLTTGAGYATNVWAGAVVLQGAVTNRLSEGIDFSISGPITGTGRFVGGKGGYVRLVYSDNSFGGANGFSGVVENGVAVGGLELMNTNIVGYSHDVPIAFTNANLAVCSTKPAAVAMDALSFDVASAGATATLRGSSVPGSPTVAASLLKTGAGTLVVSRPLTVSGETAIRGGTLRFECPGGGLEYFRHIAYVASPEETTSYSSKGTYLNAYSPRSKAYEAFSNNYTRVGVDSSGATMTFTKWEGNELVFSYHAYVGEIFVPGSAEDTVSWNFASRFQRGVWVEIDDQTVFDLRDIKQYDASGANEISQTSYAMRFVTSPAFSLNGGWHKIFVAVGNAYGQYNYAAIGPAGAYTQNGVNWNIPYLGLALNMSGTCTSNAADYVALKDPGDGSFLRLSTAQRQAIDSVDYRPAFDGPVSFAAGTVFDIGDTAPYVPFVVTNSFAGVTTVSNGILKIAGEWSPDFDAVAADVPLRAVDGAGLAFAPGATLLLPGDAAPSGLSGKVLLVADEASSVSGAENLAFVKNGRQWRAVWSEDRKTLTLKSSGVLIVFR